MEKDDAFICKMAKEPIEIQNLIELGFEFVCDFEGTFKVCAEQHRGNGYSGPPMKLLWKKTKERFPERAANAF